jgi:flagella basal body P-ring formation protein FlgA
MKNLLPREIGMIAVELEAVALEDGSMGDIIALETRGAGRGRDSKALSAEVVGRGRAVVR